MMETIENIIKVTEYITLISALVIALYFLIKKLNTKEKSYEDIVKEQKENYEKNNNEQRDYFMAQINNLRNEVIDEKRKLKEEYHDEILRIERKAEVWEDKVWERAVETIQYYRTLNEKYVSQLLKEAPPQDPNPQ